MNCGKTYWLMAEIIRLMQMFPGNEGVLARMRNKDLTRSTLPVLDEMIPPKMLLERNKSEGRYTLRTSGKPSTLWCSDLEDANKFKSMNLGFFAVEEATDVKDATAINMLATRLRRQLPGIKRFGLFTSNPEPGIVKDMFVENPKIGFKFFQPDWKENPAHTVEYRETMRGLMPADLFSRYFEGSWDAFDDQIFLPKYIQTGQPTNPIAFKVMAVDLAISEKSSADETAIVTLGVEYETNKIYELETVHGRWSFDAIINAIEDAYKRNKPDLLGVEYVAFQKSVGDVLTRKGLPVIALRADTDKVRRAMSVSHIVEQGRVYINGAPLRRQLVEFPNGIHDDLVDAFVYALRMLKEYSEEAYARKVDKFKNLDPISKKFWQEDEESKAHEEDMNEINKFFL